MDKMPVPRSGVYWESISISFISLFGTWRHSRPPQAMLQMGPVGLLLCGNGEHENQEELDCYDVLSAQLHPIFSEYRRVGKFSGRA